MTAKPIPAWAVDAAFTLSPDGHEDPHKIARLLVATREAALRDAAGSIRRELMFTENQDRILALIDKDPAP